MHYKYALIVGREQDTSNRDRRLSSLLCLQLSGRLPKIYCANIIIRRFSMRKIISHMVVCTTAVHTVPLLFGGLLVPCFLSLPELMDQQASNANDYVLPTSLHLQYLIWASSNKLN